MRKDNAYLQRGMLRGARYGEVGRDGARWTELTHRHGDRRVSGKVQQHAAAGNGIGGAGDRCLVSVPPSRTH